MWRETKILLIDDNAERRRDLAVILGFLGEDHIARASSEWREAVGKLESSREVLNVLLGDVTAKGGPLELLKQTPLHMALVVDEFGALEGVVTPTDLLEMIAGDFDEGHDAATPEAIIKREDGSYLVDGRAEVDDLAKALGADFTETSQFHTVAGLVLHEIGRLPAEGDVFEIGGYRVEVIDMDDRRIDKLLFTKLADPDEPSLADILSS